jgi:RNA polymerase-binding protein DksA
MKNSTHLSAKRRLIDRRRALLRRSEQTLTEEQRLLEAVEPDWEDVAANVSAASLLDRLGDAELRQLRRVQAALERMDHGTYGRCLFCKQPIEPRRLEIVPEAELCVDCVQTN